MCLVYADMMRSSGELPIEELTNITGGRAFFPESVYDRGDVGERIALSASRCTFKRHLWTTRFRGRTPSRQSHVVFKRCDRGVNVMIDIKEV
jgi:hypothetical protein